jgi:hypothetical protein
MISTITVPLQGFALRAVKRAEVSMFMLAFRPAARFAGADQALRHPAHVARLLAKLGARDRVQLVITASEAGLVASPH